MYCSQCHSYIPSGLELCRCPSCDVDLNTAPPKERLDQPKIDVPPQIVKSEEKKNNIRVGYLWYVGFFLLFAVVCAYGNYESQYTLSFVIWSGLSYAFASIGILLYAIRFSNKILAWLWKLVSISFVLHLITEGILDSTAESVPRLTAILIWIVAVILFYPALKANFSLGFGGFGGRAQPTHVWSVTFLIISFFVIVLYFVSWLSIESSIGLWIMILLACLFRLLIFRTKGKRYVALSILLGIGIWVLTSAFVIQPYQIIGNSMAPAIGTNDRTFVAKYLKVPKRGDIVIFKWPNIPNKSIICRIVGLPEETIQIHNGKILINGSAITEKQFDKNYYYEGKRFAKEDEVLKIPPNQYFALGDNSAMSEDSRNFGFIPSGNIEGIIALIVKPFLKYDTIGALTAYFGVKKYDSEPPYDFTYYYKKPEPDKIPRALQQYLDSNEFRDTEFDKNRSLFQVAFIFGRIARLNPQILPRYHELFDKSDNKQRKFLIFVFQFGGNDSTRKFLKQREDDPRFRAEREWIKQTLSRGLPLPLTRLNAAVEDSNDLDMKWSEFLITGNVEPVKQILEVFAWKDIVRGKLLSYLTSSKKDEKALNVLREHYGIHISGKDIISKEDLDIKVGMNLMNGEGKEEFQIIKAAIALTDEDVMRAAIKSAAFWSTGSNALQHEKVFATVKEAIEKTNGAQRIELLMIASRSAMESGDMNTAEKYLTELVSLNPTDADALELLFHLYIKENESAKARNLLEKILRVDLKKAGSLQQEMLFYDFTVLTVPAHAKTVDALKYTELIMKAREQLEAYESKSKMVVKDNSGKALGETIEWCFKHVLPDRYDVEQYTEDDADKWITIGKDSYAFFGLWFKEPASSDIGNRNFTNDSISIQKYYEMIQGVNPAFAKIFDSKYGSIIWLKYDNLNQIKSFEMKGASRSLELFVNEKGLLVKAIYLQQGTLNKKQTIQEYTQVFRYDTRIKIDPPGNAIEAKGPQA